MENSKDNSFSFDTGIMLQSFEKSLAIIEKLGTKVQEKFTQDQLVNLAIAFFNNSMTYIRENKKRKDYGY